VGVEALDDEVRQAGEGSEEIGGLGEGNAEAAEAALDLHPDRGRRARRGVYGAACLEVADGRREAVAQELGHALRQRAGQHHDRERNARFAHRARLVERPRGQQLDTLPRERLGRLDRSVPVAVGLDRGDHAHARLEP